VEALSDAFILHLTYVTYIGPNWRTERPRKTKIGTEVAYVTRDSDTTFKVKGQGHQVTLVGCSNHYILYMDKPLPVDKEYSWQRPAGRRRHKACMGWSWAAACRDGAYRVASRTAC